MSRKSKSKSKYPIDKFLMFLEKETGEKVSSFDAVFRRDYAKYRHLPYPNIKNASENFDYIVPTWINAILHADMTDKKRDDLFPDIFDLGNRKLDKESPERMYVLLEALSHKGWNSQEKLYRKNLQTVIKGLKNTIGYDVPDGDTFHSVASLKVIGLLYMMTILRKSRLFQLIESPYIIDSKPTLEFRDSLPDPLNEEDTLLVADLISYLSIEIPPERLKAINREIITASKILETIAIENNYFSKIICIYHSGDDNQIADAYENLEKTVEKYKPEKLNMETVRLDEAMYIYLRTLELQHFSVEYKKIVNMAMMNCPIKNISYEMKSLCPDTEVDGVNFSNVKILSINTFPEFVREHKKYFRNIVKYATGLYVRPDKLEELISHSCKILLMYSFVTFGEKDPNAVVISISDCVAALCTIRYQQDNNTKITYAPFVLGQDTPRYSPLVYFDKDKSIEELLKTDYIPHGINQIMYRRFCYIHANMTGNGERYEAWIQFDTARIDKFVQCLQSYDIDKIFKSFDDFKRHFNRHTFKYKLMIPEYTIDSVNSWFKDI